MKPQHWKLSLAFVIGLSVATTSLAQETVAQEAEPEATGRPTIGKLSDDAFAAMELASVARVQATVSFLASDELGGRRSMTPQFDIAAAYVASRLQAAGAEGLGPDGSFYVTNEVEMTFAPATGASISTKIAGAQVPGRIAVFSGGAKELTFAGRAQVVQSTSDELTQPGPVLANLPAEQAEALAKSPRLLAQMQSTMRREGATALLIAAASDSSLWQAAKNQSSEGNLVRGNQETMPIAVVALPSTDESTIELELTIPAAEIRKAQMRNVAAVIPGSDQELAREAVLFSAHLDHLGTTPGDASEDRIYNGADDDASGVTAVLTLADIFGALKDKPKRSAIFVTFWGEEMGLLGSREFVQDSPWPLEKVVANVNIEMIGRPEEGANNKAWMTGWKHSNLGELFRLGARRVSMEVFDHQQFGEMLYKRSDNWAFVQAGVVAHSFSAGSLHGDYHQVTDEWEKLNLTHMAQVIRGLFAGVLPIANAEVTPAATQ